MYCVEIPSFILRCYDKPRTSSVEEPESLPYQLVHDFQLHLEGREEEFAIISGGRVTLGSQDEIRRP